MHIAQIVGTKSAREMMMVHHFNWVVDMIRISSILYINCVPTHIQPTERNWGANPCLQFRYYKEKVKSIIPFNLWIIFGKLKMKDLFRDESSGSFLLRHNKYPASSLHSHSWATRIPWKSALHLLPKYCYFLVIDFRIDFSWNHSAI